MAAEKNNKYALGNNGGRPPAYETPEEMAKVAQQYFADCEDNSEPLTITGLALALGFCSRQSIYDYESREEFTYIIKRIRLIIEHDYEMSLRIDKSPTGSIFGLKNFGWKDISQVEQSGNMTIKWEESKTYNTDE